MTDTKKDPKPADAKPAPKHQAKVTRTDNSKNGYLEGRRAQRRKAGK